MFSQKMMPYIKSATLVQADSQTKTRILAAAVAILAAGAAPVPSMQVDSTNSYYAENCAMKVQETVGFFNEAAVLNCNAAVELARKFWMMRYATVHAFEISTAVVGDFFIGFTGASRQFSPEEVAFLNEHAAVITTVVRDSIGCMKVDVSPQGATAAPV